MLLNACDSRGLTMTNKPDGDGREHKALGLLPRIVIGAAVGALAFALIGTFVGCFWLSPDSNLCGLFPFLLAIPLGAIRGLHWRINHAHPATAPLSPATQIAPTTQAL